MLQKNIIYPCSANLEQYISICNTFKLPNKNVDIKFSTHDVCLTGYPELTLSSKTQLLPLD